MSQENFLPQESSEPTKFQENKKSPEELEIMFGPTSKMIGSLVLAAALVGGERKTLKQAGREKLKSTLQVC